jgi:RNA polymerase sigma-70 factor, ECF subfamily
MDNQRHLTLVPEDATAPAGAPRVALAEREDDDLVLLARGGLLQAFDELVRRHQPRVLGLAAKYLGRVELAPDVAQNTFLAVYRSLPGYRPQGRFAAYLFKILLNQCRMTRRSHVFQHRALEAVQWLGEPSGPDVEERLLERERRREVERALEGLSEKLRVVLILRYTGALSLAEIADTLELPLGTVKRRLFDGVERLRRELERAEP